MTPIKPDIFDFTRKIACDEVFPDRCSSLTQDRHRPFAVYQVLPVEIVTLCQNGTGKSRPGQVGQNGLKRKGGQRPGEGGRAFVRRTWQGGGRAIGARLEAIFMIAMTSICVLNCGNSREAPITNL
jgi:hypothetical protein